MKRILIVLLAAVSLAGCGSDKEGPEGEEKTNLIQPTNQERGNNPYPVLKDEKAEAIEDGASIAEVRRRVKIKPVLDQVEKKTGCILYAAEGNSGEGWSFCFNDDELFSKDKKPDRVGY